MSGMTDASGIVAEIEDLIRTAPDIYTSWGGPQHFDWLGRARAVLSHKLVNLGIEAQVLLMSALSNNTMDTSRGQLLILLQNARHKLRIETVGPMSLAVGKGMGFDYFDRVRQLVEEAQSDLLFVDPYLDADFVSRYLSFAKNGVTVRLLGREKMSTLLPAVDAFRKQHQKDIEVRSGSFFHDRFLFIDRRRGIQSGASFSGGGVKTPTVVLELTDALADVMATYEGLWINSDVKA